MLALAADENFNNDIVRGALRRHSELDIVRVQDAGLSGADDATVLEWTAQQGRVLFTHDVSTMTGLAYERVLSGKRMPGVFEVSRDVPVSLAIDDLVLPSAVSKANGKVRCDTCRYGEDMDLVSQHLLTEATLRLQLSLRDATPPPVWSQ